MKDDLQRVIQARRQLAKEGEKHFEEQSSERLGKILRRKFLTVTVGAVATLERLWGHLWGHGLQEKECSPAQLAWRPHWEELRQEIFDNGNAQLRAAMKELGQHTIKWTGFHYELTPPGKEDVKDV